jgi:hypothetical protein
LGCPAERLLFKHDLFVRKILCEKSKGAFCAIQACSVMLARNPTSLLNELTPPADLIL